MRRLARRERCPWTADRPESLSWTAAGARGAAGGSGGSAWLCWLAAQRLVGAAVAGGGISGELVAVPWATVKLDKEEGLFFFGAIVPDATTAGWVPSVFAFVAPTEGNLKEDDAQNSQTHDDKQERPPRGGKRRGGSAWDMAVIKGFRRVAY